MVDFVAAIKKPFTNKQALILGLILSAIPIVNWFVNGYMLKVAQDTIKGKKELRSWALKDVPDYIVKTIIAFVIGVLYMIVPLIILIAGIGSAIITALMTFNGDQTQIQQAVLNALMTGAPLIVLGVILAIIAALILPMALMKWLKKDSVKAAFNIVEVVKNCFTGKYVASIIVSVIYAIVVFAILGAIAALLALIPFVGWVIALLVIGLASFMIYVSAYTMFAQSVKN